MTKMFPNESPIAVPGVKVTIPYLPCESEVIDETRTEPEKIRYTFTADKTFVEGRTYYTLAEGKGYRGWIPNENLTLDTAE